VLLRHRDGLPWRAGAHPPGGENLTGFYVALSFGGMVGDFSQA